MIHASFQHWVTWMMTTERNTSLLKPVIFQCGHVCLRVHHMPNANICLTSLYVFINTGIYTPALEIQKSLRSVSGSQKGAYVPAGRHPDLHGYPPEQLRPLTCNFSCSVRRKIITASSQSTSRTRRHANDGTRRCGHVCRMDTETQKHRHTYCISSGRKSDVSLQWKSREGDNERVLTCCTAITGEKTHTHTHRRQNVDV